MCVNERARERARENEYIDRVMRFLMPRGNSSPTQSLSLSHYTERPALSFSSFGLKTFCCLGSGAEWLICAAVLLTFMCLCKIERRRLICQTQVHRLERNKERSMANG